MILKFLNLLLSALLSYWQDSNIAVMTFDATLPMHEFIIPGEYFYKNILHFDQEKLESFKRRSFIYFEEKFGLNVSTSIHPDLSLMLYQTNPRLNTTCLRLPDEPNIPAHGFKVLSGGLIVRVTNISGYDLGGEFEGMHVPYGTTFSIGHSLIKRGKKPDILWERQDSQPGSVAQFKYNMITTGKGDVFTTRWGRGETSYVTNYTFVDQVHVHALYVSSTVFFDA